MPVNPMQRRIRNSFLGGFFIALLIIALAVVTPLFLKMKALQDEMSQLLALQKVVYVAGEDFESGETVTIESFVKQTVQTTVDVTQIISEEDFSFLDENGEVILKYNNDGSEKLKEVVMRVDVPAGTIVTKNMIADSTADITDDLREQEFNMILLPSQLKTGDYVDVRLSMPEGQDYIVLSKKKALKTTETGIWFTLSEEEILTINNAIVESYQIPGSKLYAIEYDQPGIQAAAVATYPVSSRVLELIRYNPNIIEEAKNALYSRYYANDQAEAIQRTTVIDAALAENLQNKGGNQNAVRQEVENNNNQEASKIQAAREEYLSTLGE